MNRTFDNLKRTLLTVIAAAIFAPLASAETIAVPMEVGTIQEAIDLAQGDDIVLVSPGKYNETINFNGI